MLRIALMGVTLGTELSTFGKLPVELPDDSSIELSATELKLPHATKVYVVWRRQIDEKILTWIGAYHHALEIGGSRDGGYYGAGVWLLGTTARGAAVSHLLDNLSEQVHVLAMEGGQQFLRKLSDIRLEIAWPEQAVDVVGYSMQPIVSGLGLGTGDLPTAYIDLSDPLDASSLDWCLDSVQTSVSFSGFSRMILCTSAEVSESVKGFGRYTVMTPSQMVRADAEHLSELVRRVEHANIAMLEKNQAVQELKVVQQTLQNDRAEAKLAHDILQQRSKQAELLVQKEKQAQQQTAHELNSVKQKLQYDRTESQKLLNNVQQKLHRTEQLLKKEQQALHQREQEFQQLVIRADGEKKRHQDAAAAADTLRANYEQAKTLKAKADKDLADVKKQLADQESETDRLRQEREWEQKQVAVSDQEIDDREMEPQFDLDPFSYSQTVVAVCDNCSTAEANATYFQQRYDTLNRSTDTSRWQAQSKIAELEDSKNSNELEIAGLDDRIAKLKKYAWIAVGIVAIATLIMVGTISSLVADRDDLQAQLDTAKIRLSAAQITRDKQTRSKYFDTQYDAYRQFCRNDACLKEFSTQYLTRKMSQQFFTGEVPLCPAR